MSVLLWLSLLAGICVMDSGGGRRGQGPITCTGPRDLAHLHVIGPALKYLLLSGPEAILWWTAFVGLILWLILGEYETYITDILRL